MYCLMIIYIIENSLFAGTGNFWQFHFLFQHILELIFPSLPCHCSRATQLDSGEWNSRPLPGLDTEHPVVSSSPLFSLPMSLLSVAYPGVDSKETMISESAHPKHLVRPRHKQEMHHYSVKLLKIMF